MSSDCHFLLLSVNITRKNEEIEIIIFFFNHDLKSKKLFFSFFRKNLDFFQPSHFVFVRLRLSSLLPFQILVCSFRAVIKPAVL